MKSISQMIVDLIKERPRTSNEIAAELIRRGVYAKDIREIRRIVCILIGQLKKRRDVAGAIKTKALPRVCYYWEPNHDNTEVCSSEGTPVREASLPPPLPVGESGRGSEAVCQEPF